MSLRRLSIVAALSIAGFSGCSEDSKFDNEGYAGDGTFGGGSQSGNAGVADPDAANGGSQDGGVSATPMRLRVLQGVLNLRAAYLCHDPDFDLEDPDAGPEPAVELPFEVADGGLALGVPTSYADVPAMTSGAITVHRLPSLDAGSADAGLSDAGLRDAGGLDATLDAQTSDGEAPEPAPRCDRASVEAVLPLPMPASWVDPPRADLDGGAALDAGLSPEARGFVSSVSGGGSLTLFGSGVLIDPSELDRRVEERRKRYLQAHQGADEELAVAAAERYRRALEAAHGPRFLLSRAGAPKSERSFALHFSHLIPDVSAASDKGDAGSGALHLCMTVGTMEGSERSDAGAGGFDFRNHVALGDDLDPALGYRFRVFAQSAYATEQKSCATTSMKPVAELMVEAGWFKAGRSYSLVAWGALAPDSICTTYVQGSLIRPGCAQSADKLQARLEIIEDE